MIFASTDSWGAEVGGKRGDAVDVKAISQYLKGRTLPICPDGGHYSIPSLGDNPTCSLHGDLLGPSDFPHKWEPGFYEALLAHLKTNSPQMYARLVREDEEQMRTADPVQAVESSKFENIGAPNNGIEHTEVPRHD